ncbi:MAG: hypothetical protein VX460_11505 [Planctomycetota bacterium]|nr:hypothetical protein [Planctomycetota bacterium]
MAGPTKSRSAHDLEPPTGQSLLKRNLKRSVLADVGRDGRRSLLKVFHAPGLGRLRDRGRALREERAHRLLRAAGLPCAAPLGVERVGGRWALRLGLIEGAVPLSVALQDGRRRVALAGPLAALGLAAERARLAHPDLHAGNLLVDPGGAVHLSDVGAARLGAAESSVREQWIQLAGELMELDPRFLAATDARWRAAGGGDTAGPIAAFVDEARRRRASRMARRVRVWRRESSATWLEEEGGRLVVRARACAPAGWEVQRLEGDRRRVEATWATLVRATLHRLPTAAPLGCALAPPWFVEYAVPPGSSRLVGGEPAGPLRVALERSGLGAKGELIAHGGRAALVGPRTLLSPPARAPGRRRDRTRGAPNRRPCAGGCGPVGCGRW